MRLAIGVSAVVACLSLGACTQEGGVEGAVEPVELPANLCESVPDDLGGEWSLDEAEHAVDNGDSLATASCRMSGPDTELDLSVTSLGGGSAGSAEKFASEEQVDRCGNVRSLGGDYTNDDTSCTTVVADGPVTTVATVAQVVGSHGVTRVEMSGPAARREEVEDAVSALADAMASVVGGG